MHETCCLGTWIHRIQLRNKIFQLELSKNLPGTNKAINALGVVGG